MRRDDEIRRIRQEAENRAKWEELNRRLVLLGETRPSLIQWDNMDEDLILKHIDLALKHECYRYVQLLHNRLNEIKLEQMKKYLRGEL